MKHITIGQAFAYCFTQPSYIITLIVGAIIAAAGIFYVARRYSKTGDWDARSLVITIISVCVFAACLLGRPTSVTDTTTEQAARGVYIG